jgi:hypothetical protein
MFGIDTIKSTWLLKPQKTVIWLYSRENTQTKSTLKLVIPELSKFVKIFTENQIFQSIFVTLYYLIQ